VIITFSSEVDTVRAKKTRQNKDYSPVLISIRTDKAIAGERDSEMARNGSLKRSPKPQKPSYILDEQIGFILRQVWQRHATIFAREIGINLTSAQWAALSKLAETGPCSQNLLGRLTAMDVATIKGVIDRLTARGLTETSPDPEDGRRLLVSLTRAGQQLVEKAAPNALAISKETLAPLDVREREIVVALLNKLR
jgi:DNA-binding MarR family transcriptional regulator